MNTSKVEINSLILILVFSFAIYLKHSMPISSTESNNPIQSFVDQ